ncbi:transposase, MuDR, MULE transposase domain protein [Artemisia annua]|uniref:Transposase, MuDR, MULE transposase domain protein n=1 Tax=Artemisia annua TaxID=35608 RepID=A0A2U1N0D6_ARTAN|nr:transposase, MuDR, MULE transposase domain protein [Artemisia annua]
MVVKLPSIDSLLDITDDNEVNFFVQCALESPSEIVELVDENIGSPSDVSSMNVDKNDILKNDSGYKHEANFTKPGHHLLSKIPRTVTRIKTNNVGVFEILFIAIGALLRTFQNHLRPILIVGAAHLKGVYKGTNLQAVGMDGNNQIVPIAYGICRGETGDCWSWWMSVLKECIGDNPNMVIISDRHPSIALSVRNEFPSAFYGICCRHLMMNLKLKIKKVKGLYWGICKAYTPDEWQRKMNILLSVQLEAYQKLMEADPTRWSRAHCPSTRYNYCTSNSVESLNSCTVKYRKLPVTMLTDTYRDMVQKWYFNRRKSAAKMKYKVTNWAADNVEKRKRKSVRWVVYGINQFQYQVSDGHYNREVNLRTNECECQKWQLSGIPCGYVIAFTRFLGLTDYVQYVQEWFKKEKYQATYAESIQFVGNFNEWEYPSHIHPVTPPNMDNPQPGCPKNTNRIPSQGKQKHQEFSTDEQPYGQNSYAWQDYGQNSYPWQPYGQNTYPTNHYDQNQYNTQTFDHTQYASQSYYHNAYPSQQYDQNTNASQTYDQYHTQPSFNMSQQNQTQTLQNDHQYPSHMYQQYDSQQYASQHLDDHNTQDSNSWFNRLGF